MQIPAGIARSLQILGVQRRLVGGPAVDESTFQRVTEAFDAAHARWVLVGAHAVNTYARPRATEDIDFVVEGRRVKAVRAALGGEAIEMGPGYRMTDLNVDLIRSDTHELFRRALDEAVERDGVRVPPAEILVALKFMAATSPWRSPADRQQDAADLIRVYQATEPFDRDRAASAAASAFPGADRELREMLDRIDRGEDVRV